MPEHPLASSTYYMRQIPGLTNACGTIAMLHAILNNRGVLGLEGGAGILEQFYQETKALGAEERGGKLHDSKEIGELHNGWEYLCGFLFLHICEFISLMICPSVFLS